MAQETEQRTDTSPGEAEPVPHTDRPGPRERHRMRARMEEYERTRETLLLELGALVHELQRHGERAPRLLLPKAAEVAAVDAEIRALATDSARKRGAAAPTCQTCEQTLEPGQLVCLHCGAVVDFRLPPVENRWPKWVAVAAIVIGLTVGGVVIGTTFADDGTAPSAGSSSQELQLGDRAGERDGAGRAELPEASPSGSRPKTDETPKRSSELVKRGEVYEWPTSLRGYTVVLTSNGDRASAQRFAESAADSDPDRQYGVLSSDDFSSLPQDFFVVFAGRYESETEAQQAAGELGNQYGSAFAQLVQQ